jgi:hypothetical protein
VLLQARAAPVQRQPFAPPTYGAPPPGGDDAALGDYDDGDWTDEELPASRLLQRPAWLRFGGFVTSMSLIGALLALGFDYSGLRAHAAAWSWSAVAPDFGAGPRGPQADDRLTSALAEIDTLHRSVSELSARVQQFATTNAALEAGEQELRRRMASLQVNVYWYSDPATLQLRFVTPAKAGGGRLACTRERGNHRDDPAERQRAAVAAAATALTAPRSRPRPIRTPRFTPL